MVREGGRVVRVDVLLATGVNADGHREIPVVDVTRLKTVPAGWRSSWALFTRGLGRIDERDQMRRNAHCQWFE